MGIDHVDKSQSINDLFPAIVHLAVLKELNEKLKPNILKLTNGLRRKAIEF